MCHCVACHQSNLLHQSSSCSLLLVDLSLLTPIASLTPAWRSPDYIDARSLDGPVTEAVAAQVAQVRAIPSLASIT